MTYRLILFIFFPVIIALLAWAWLLPPKIMPSTPQHRHTASPDAWMTTVDATFMGRDGQILMKIHAPTMKHYAENDTTLLISPLFLLYKHSPNPWRIQAGLGTATSGIEKIHLSNAVTLHHPGDNVQPATWVTTDKLTIHPNQKTADTTQKVTLTQPNVTMHGTGLQADLNTGEIKLLSETRGEYAINQ